SFASLASAAGTAIQIDGHAASLPTLTDLSAGSLFVQGGGTAVAPRLVNVDSATLIASDGMTLSLPAVTSIKHETTAPNQSATLRAEGFGSRLDLPAVTSIQNGDDYNSRVFIEALSGAVVDLSSVQTIEDPDVGNASQRRIELLGEGIGSLIDLGGLQSFIDHSSGTLTGSNRFSSVLSRYGGTVDLGSNDTSGASLGGIHVTAGEAGILVGKFTLESDSVLTGNGLVRADVIVGGIVDPQEHLIVDGSLSLLSGGQLNFDIGGLTSIEQHDVLEITGTATLDGILRTNRVNDYAPQPGDSYVVMTYGSRSGSPRYAGLDFGSQILSPELSPTSLEFVTGFSSGAAVLSVTVSDSAVDPDGPFFVIEFSEPIERDSLSADDIALVGPADTSVAVESIVPLDASNARFVVRPVMNQYTDGDYSLTIGPNVFDWVGNPMNQDGDEINGEPNDDRWSGNLHWALPDLMLVGGVLPTVATEFDFGDEVPLLFDVKNVGAATAGGESWTDRIYLSTDNVFDLGDLLLHELIHDTTLKAGGTYANQ
ncbi:hypothetical protein, partial [Stieleria sp.]|uniref:hypothetical protein n=1 Tax=Stieleria sp. TaxID=2795976 RepID=UPI003563CADE